MVGSDRSEIGRRVGRYAEVVLSVERWPFHTGPPDHYDRLSSLLDLSVSQLSTLMPLHY